MRQGADHPFRQGVSRECDGVCTDRPWCWRASGWQRHRHGRAPVEQRLAAASRERAQHAAVAPALLEGLPRQPPLVPSVPCRVCAPCPAQAPSHKDPVALHGRAQLRQRPGCNSPGCLLSCGVCMPSAVGCMEAGQHGKTQALPEGQQARRWRPCAAVVCQEQVRAARWRCLPCDCSPGGAHPLKHPRCQRAGDEDVAERGWRLRAARVWAARSVLVARMDAPQEGARS